MKQKYKTKDYYNEYYKGAYKQFCIKLKKDDPMDAQLIQFIELMNGPKGVLRSLYMEWLQNMSRDTNNKVQNEQAKRLLKEIFEEGEEWNEEWNKVNQVYT